MTCFSQWNVSRYDSYSRVKSELRALREICHLLFSIGHKINLSQSGAAPSVRVPESEVHGAELQQLKCNRHEINICCCKPLGVVCYCGIADRYTENDAVTPQTGMDVGQTKSMDIDY